MLMQDCRDDISAADSVSVVDHYAWRLDPVQRWVAKGGFTTP